MNNEEPHPRHSTLNLRRTVSLRRSGNLKMGNENETRRSLDEHVSDNKDVQAAFNQLTKKGNRSNGPDNTHNVLEGQHTSSSSGSNNSFTQRLLDRGIAVPSSISHWKSASSTADQILSSSTGSHLSSSIGSCGNDFDSSTYYGLSPFVTSSSFLMTSEPSTHFNMDTGLVGANSLYESLRHRYEKESTNSTQRLSQNSEEEEEDQIMSSPELTKLNQHRARRSRPDREDSDIELSDDDLEDPRKQNTNISSSLLTTTTPFLLRTASARRRYQDNALKTRSPSPLAHTSMSTVEEGAPGEEEEPIAETTTTALSPQPLNVETPGIFDLRDPESYADVYPLRNKKNDRKKEEDIGSTSVVQDDGHVARRVTATRTTMSAIISPEADNRSHDVAYDYKNTIDSAVLNPQETHIQHSPSYNELRQMLTSKRPSRDKPITFLPSTELPQDTMWRLGSRALKNPLTEPAPLREPPRKHLLQTPVFQVVNANTVKDRYLFLFSDLLLICKPIMDENIIVGGSVTGNRENLYRFRPNEDSLFQVKNIVELSKITLYLSREEQQQQQQQQQQHRPSIIVSPEGRPMLPAPRKMHPVLASALRKFETSAENGISYLVDKQVLTNDPLSVANFLFKTPDLNRRQLGKYLANPKNSDVYEAFLDCFRLVGFRLDEALRILLTTFRLPSNWESLEYIIERFAKKWHDANQNVVKFHEDMVVRVIVAMLFLNAEVWYDASSERDVFWSARERKECKDRQRMTRRGSMDRKSNRESVAIEPLHYISALRAKGTMQLSMTDFLDRWNHFDQYALVPREFMEDMYRSITAERLETGWDNRTGRISPAQDNAVEGSGQMEQDVIITVTPHRLPTRLTKGVASAPITISIPAPDPGLQIKLRGQDLTCEPNVLDFSHSCVQTFTIIGRTLGRTSLMFIKSGEHAGHYVSPALPRTKSIVVERPFMRYTFQISFSHTDIRAVKAAAAAAAAMTGGQGGNGGGDRSNTTVKSPTDVSSPIILSNTDVGPLEEPDESSVSVGQREQPAMVKRKYTFSVETKSERYEWINHLKKLSGNVCVGTESTKEMPTKADQDNPSAEERVALQVLKEVLLADEVKKGTANVAALRSTVLGSRSSAFDPHQKPTISLTPSAKTMDDSGQDESTANEKKKADEAKGGDRTSLMSAAAGTTNVVTKRGHEITKLVVQNSMVPLMLGFLRNQIQE